MPDEVTPPADGTPVEGTAPAEPTPASAAPEGQRPGIAAIWAEEAAKAAAAEDEDDTPTPAPADAPADEPAAGDTPAAPAEEPAEGDKPADAPAEPTDADKAQADLSRLLETLEDPAALNAALEKAGVDKIQELPAVKSLMGRISQSVRDQTRAEIEKAQREAAQLADATAAGKAAKGELIAALNKLATDIENGEESLDIPDEAAIEKVLGDVAGSAVGEYHTKTWNVLSDTIYSLPEMGGPTTDENGVVGGPPEITQEQAALLEAAKGLPPAEWLAAHMTVARDRLWTWAQSVAGDGNKTTFEQEKLLLQTAHNTEIKRLGKEHETAITAAKEEARAEALADFEAGKLPPKTPKGGKPKTTADERDLDDSIPQGASIKQIREIVKARQEAGVEV